MKYKYRVNIIILNLIQLNYNLFFLDLYYRLDKDSIQYSSG